MSNTVPIAFRQGERDVRGCTVAGAERSAWTPGDLHLPWPGSTWMGEKVTIIVGAEKARFGVQESYLEGSEYFRTALNGRWREADNHTITLDDVEPEVFELYVNFVYIQKISGGMEGIRCPARAKESWLRLCIEAYALGDRLLAPKFCSAANNVFEIRFDGAFPVSGYRPLVELAFAILPSSCIILQSLVDTYGLRRTESMLDAQNGLSQDFKKRVMRRLDELRNCSRGEAGKNRCYLEHTPHSGCPTCPALHFRWDPEKEVGVFK